jgi:hypothetical protein
LSDSEGGSCDFEIDWVIFIRAETGIVQVISSNASCSLEELAEARAPHQTLMWQYYVAADRSVFK